MEAGIESARSGRHEPFGCGRSLRHLEHFRYYCNAIFVLSHPSLARMGHPGNRSFECCYLPDFFFGFDFAVAALEADRLAVFAAGFFATATFLAVAFGFKAAFFAIGRCAVLADEVALPRAPVADFFDAGRAVA